MVVQFLGHVEGCLEWFDPATCATTPTPPPPVCPDLNNCSYPPTCGGFNWINMNWTQGYCVGPDTPNGIITAPLSMYYQTGYGWVYSTSTVSASLTCINNQWIFNFDSNTIDGSWTVQIVFTPDANDPCNVIGLSGQGTITTNIINPNPCNITEPISATISQLTC
jgi:hypothetical protein